MIITRIPCRYILVLMIFLVSCYIEMIRANISMNLVAMVPVVGSNVTSNEDTINWSPYERAHVLGATFWGAAAGNFLGGPIAEKWSPRILTFIGILSGGILTTLSPIAAKHSFMLMMVTRITLGYVTGLCFPAAHSLIARWAVPEEKGLYVGAIVGGTMGIFFAWVLCGYIIESFGWEWGFYVFSLMCPVICILWWFLIYDSPDDHPRMSMSERTFLKSKILVKKDEKIPYPVKPFLTSIPVWSLYILNFGAGWALYFFITAAPNYIANALKYDIASTGLLSASMHLGRSTVAIITGYFAAICLKKKVLTLVILRKGGIAFSHIFPGLILLAITIQGYPTIFYVTVMGVTMTLNGFVPVTSAVNAHDLTSNFVGSLGGLVSSFIALAGVVTPLVTAHFTKEDETDVESWNKVFYVAIGVIIITGVQFIVFGSTEKQPWDYIKSETKVKN